MLIKPVEMARAIGFGIGTGAVLTVILSYVGILGLLGYLGMGFLVGEAVSVGAHRKRARELGPVAVVCVFLGYELGGAIALLIQFGGRLEVGPALFLAPLAALRGLLLVGLLVGALLAWMRVR
jgi:hypothetical protein